MNIKETITKTFIDIFNRESAGDLFFAPGRINLIGEHTDYNGGHVFPAAISLGTYAMAAKRSDKKVRFYSMNIPETQMIECDLEDLSYHSDHHWANYPKGMIYLMKEHGCAIDSGMDILYNGNIPNSAGLSSSASIEMVTGVLVQTLFHTSLDRIAMIKTGQQVENRYIGVQSGIMDQFAIGMGKANHAIHLDTNTLSYTYAPITLSDHSIMIIHTNKTRTLHDSKYNERREQCEQALRDLQSKLNIQTLGELSSEEFDAHQHLIQNKTNRKRAKHAVYENERTIQALKKLNEHDLIGFGQLMNASHLSLKVDYEVSGIELDTIVENAWKQPGVIGARMTGAGFGGCAIAIIENAKINAFKQKINDIYVEEIGYAPNFYTAHIGDGARKITEEVI